MLQVEGRKSERARHDGEDGMTMPPMRPVEASLVDLFQHLGIDRAHFAAGQLTPTDWVGLAARYPERIGSLPVVSTRLRHPGLEALGPRLMVLAGDAGPSAQGPRKVAGRADAGALAR